MGLSAGMDWFSCPKSRLRSQHRKKWEEVRSWVELVIEQEE
jgi:hypothetical protein